MIKFCLYLDFMDFIARTESFKHKNIFKTTRIFCNTHISCRNAARHRPPTCCSRRSPLRKRRQRRVRSINVMTKQTAQTPMTILMSYRHFYTLLPQSHFGSLSTVLTVNHISYCKHVNTGILRDLSICDQQSLRRVNTARA